MIQMHEWSITSYRDDQKEVEKIGPVPLFSIDCHRHHRGPYTGAGELVRILVSQIYRSKPDLVLRHVRTLLSLAPEIKDIVLSLAPEMKAIIGMDHAFGVPFTALKRDEGYYQGIRTRRLSHGLADFLLQYLTEQHLSPCSIAFEHVDMADDLDQEFLTILLRRAKPEKLQVRIRTSSLSLPEPFLSLLNRYTFLRQPRLLSEEDQPNELFSVLSPAARDQLARVYVESDCTSDNSLEQAAYQLLDPALRRQFHRDRVTSLENTQQKSFSLGALPYHYERAYDPTVDGSKIVMILLSACQYCVTIGYYRATLDLGERGCQLAEKLQQTEDHWLFTKAMIIANLMLGEFSQVERLCHDMQASTQHPPILASCMYFLTILHVRFYSEGKRDYVFARQKIQEAIQFAHSQPPSYEQTIDTIFFEKNTLALIELRLKHSNRALQLLTEGLEQLKQELSGERFEIESPIFWGNRARLYQMQGQLDLALQDYTTVIQLEPFITDYHYERAGIYRALGRYKEALEDYNCAILCSPPYPEVYYNRACLLSILERNEEALEDYTHVLELDPEFIDARLNRASILYQQERYKEARKDVEDGLVQDPHNADLLCTLGLLEMEEQQQSEAYDAFSKALEANPQLHAAWINRGTLSFENGQVDMAIGDFTQVLSIDADATAFYNRGLAYQSQERWLEALDDYEHALALSDEDTQDIFYQRSLCYVGLGKHHHCM